MSVLMEELGEGSQGLEPRPEPAGPDVSAQKTFFHFAEKDQPERAELLSDHGSVSTKLANLGDFVRSEKDGQRRGQLTRHVVQKFVFMTVHGRRSDDGCIRERVSNTLFAFRLGLVKIRFGIDISV
jgi:hypothetical protein